MKRKIYFILILFIAVFGGLVFLFFNNDGSKNNNYLQDDLIKFSKIKIAVCPTCLELLQKVNLDKNKYEIIKTSSTAESLSLLTSAQVDMIIAGRTLKPNEASLDFLKLDNGYAFLAEETAGIYNDDLMSYNFYTDTDIDIIKNIFGIQKIQRVSDVYDYVDKGIIITSWDNVDYDRAELVYLLDNNGQKVRLSRQPTIYCPNACDDNATEIANLTKLNNN